MATGTVRGLVHDAQHRPVAGARASLRAVTSSLQFEQTTTDEGLFTWTAVPAGEYELSVEAESFATQKVRVVVKSGETPVFHMELAAKMLEQQVDVRAQEAPVESVSPRPMVNRESIERYAGADGANSMRVITEFLPGATVVHDQLHVRGGHQVSWAIDGVPIPNTNIATNLAPQFNPKDMDYLELQSGGFSADYGDRTYGVFNVIPRTGFERAREAELVASYGSFHATDDQLSFGDHGQRTAYFLSLSGNRTDHGLETPTQANEHNLGSGGSGYTSLIWNRSASDQLRADGSFRADFYQIPVDPTAPLPDREREQDGFAIVSWLHTISPGTLLTVAPFYHLNRAAYEGAAGDLPTVSDNRRSQYGGGQAILSTEWKSQSLRAGMYGFAQRDTSRFALAADDGTGAAFAETMRPTGSLEAYFAEDRYALERHGTQWLTLSGGVRVTRFSGNLDETAASPRLGAAVRVPGLGWTVRATYSRFYQAPPLDTVTGALGEFATASGLGFLPLHGERDEQREFGLAIPFRGWTADFATFRTGARNYFDHGPVGSSNLFLSLTVDHARIAGYEASVRSSLLLGRAHAHLVYSNQRAQGYGAVTGGLTDFSPPEAGGFYLDHDQRNTLSAVADTALPGKTFASLTMNYGSGFLNGNGPDHLPQYATVDLSCGKSFGEALDVRVSATNVGNEQYQLDLSNTFGGSHYGEPRMVSVQVKYRFRL